MTDFFDELGFATEQCHYCGARLWKAEDGKLLCLNGCSLPHGLMLRMNQELAAIYRKNEEATIYRKNEETT